VNKNKIISIFYFIVGIGIIGLWIMLFATNQIPELETEPVSIAFHIVIEVSMGIMSILTGYFILKNHKFSQVFLLFTAGMLSYSVINSSGYYGDLGNFAMIVMFGVILIGVITSLFLFKKQN